MAAGGGPAGPAGAANQGGGQSREEASGEAEGAQRALAGTRHLSSLQTCTVLLERQGQEACELR